ncbi:MAG: hypothetical protein BJ554DRAFT_344 [Olpidium bornovanus]|uniref:Uncharacterized protein n=1 Tax=Olpidium bornovanus TaxID=278681 RepID=A0A8H7ZUI1_9FUNG|nr:MAG: hypothetical protein BJ554DRAFT_344 [Olpidium bornovanus]
MSTQLLLGLIRWQPTREHAPRASKQEINEVVCSREENLDPANRYTHPLSPKLERLNQAGPDKCHILPLPEHTAVHTHRKRKFPSFF